MKAEPSKVIEEIIELRTKRGYSSPSLVSYLKETYDINTTRAYELIKEARIKLGEIYREVNGDVLMESIVYMENQRQKALAEGNGKLALEIQKELNKINQLYIERKEVNISGNIDVRNLFGFDENDDDDSVNDKA